MDKRLTIFSVHDMKQENPANAGSCWGCGEGGIRTLDTLLKYTHFPGVLFRPLRHLSGKSDCKGKIIARIGNMMILISQPTKISVAAFSEADQRIFVPFDIQQAYMAGARELPFLLLP